MKKSSKAVENPNIKDAKPIHNAKIAQPWNKF
jgi:hypothetical protein